MGNRLNTIILIFSASIIILGLSIIEDYNERINSASASFFSNALRAARISETVSIHGIKYRVENGDVAKETGSTITPKEKLNVLKTTYALAMARRSPLFGIAGTDPKALRQSVDKLKEVVHNLSLAQEKPEDAIIVASSLYPINFLYSLANLEEDRLKFLASGSDTNLKNYNKHLNGTIRAEKTDIKNFKKAFQRKIGDKSISILGSGGVITTKSLLKAISLIQEGISRNETVLEKRRSCLSGKIEFCNESDIQIPILPKLMTNLKAPSDRSIPPLTEEVMSIYREASGRLIAESDIFVFLDSSACLRALR